MPEPPRKPPNHTPMTDHSLYIAMTNFTRRVFGKVINPHRFRHIDATSIVVAARRSSRPPPAPPTPRDHLDTARLP